MFVSHTRNEAIASTRVLVAIASYGTAGDRYLARIVEEYRSMSFHVDIVVLSNASKEVPPGVELRIGLPTQNPWSLPFGHKQIFADRLHQYDLFIYSEDDILITERNIRAFLWATEILGKGEIAGFMLVEIGPDGGKHYPQAHGPFHWDVSSIRCREGDIFAFFTNEHAASYMLTRSQLQQAIDSREFLVPPHDGKYDMLCSAATDPYTRCGFTKLICISRLDDFSLHHLPNKYIGKLGVSGQVFQKQAEALLKIGQNGAGTPASLFRPETKLKGSPFSKNYYEPARKEIAPLISTSVRTVLSIGCGNGATEVWLAKRGLRVVAVPMDPVISAEIEGSGVHLVNGDFNRVIEQLAGQRFDCLLMLNVLHLVENPSRLLHSFCNVLSDQCQVIATVPNVSRIFVLRKRLQGNSRFRHLGRYEVSGMHVTSHTVIRRWFKQAGLTVVDFVHLVPKRADKVQRMTLNMMRSLLASEVIVVGTKS